MGNNVVEGFTKITLRILCGVSILGTVLQLIPIPSESLWPLNAVARELWPWLLVFNVLALALTIARQKMLSAVFALGSVVAGWPLLQLHGIASSMKDQWQANAFPAEQLPHPDMSSTLGPSFAALGGSFVSPQKLPLGILLFGTDGPDRPAPIVIQIHGGSWQHGSPNDNADFCSYFALRGWKVFSLNYRLAPADKYPAQIDDVRASINWIHQHATEYDADPSRIVLIGHSAGGHLAMLAGFTEQAILIRGIVNFYGPGDLAELYRHPPQPDPIDVRAKLTAFLGGSIEQRSQTYLDASPINQIKTAVPPTLLIQGALDHVVEPAHTRALQKQLLDNGNRSLLLELPWSDHSFDFVHFGPGNALAMQYIDAFMRIVADVD